MCSANIAVILRFFKLRAVETQLHQALGNVQRHETEYRRGLALFKEAEERGDMAARDTLRVRAPPD